MIKLYLGTEEVIEVLQYATTSAKSPMPGTRIMFFRIADTQKKVTAMFNPALRIVMEPNQE